MPETMPETPVVSVPQPPPSKWAWLWEHRKPVALALGIGLGIACPYLGVIAGPCKLVATVLRGWVFDGQALP